MGIGLGLRKNTNLKYFVGFLVLVSVVLAVSYRQGALPPNMNTDPKNDFIHISEPPSNVAQLLKTQCYSCHSAQAKYPQLAHFAPFHKPFIKPVTQGRAKLNFSNWGLITPEVQKVLLLIAVEQLENNAMPIQGVFEHGTDTLTQNSKMLLTQWLAQEAEAGM